jgi:hypothetical protein
LIMDVEVKMASILVCRNSSTSSVMRVGAVDNSIRPETTKQCIRPKEGVHD